MKNVLFFVLLGALLTFTVAEELEDILMSNEDEDISGVGAAVLQCKKDLAKCIASAIADGNDPKECAAPYKQCLLDAVPPFLKKCSDERKKCLDNAKGFFGKIKCNYAFAKCLKDNRPQ